MCGLAGIFSLNGKPIENAANRITAMTDRLKHRGPDSQGTMVTDDGLLALGNTRLAVTDPKAPIALPARSHDERAALSFNGEIYNYAEIRKALVSRGVNFRYRTDTEVLLEGLHLDGEKFLSCLDGMWAFAFYEIDQGRLILSRDLMGERHLFYRIQDGELVFASEAQPILADRGKPESIDFGGLVSAVRYNAAPPGRTLVQGLHRLHPGHNLVATTDGQWRQNRYRKLQPEKWFDFFASDPPLDAVVDEFENLMHSASLLRIPPDVPFISTLSGGLDSSLVCTYASDYGKQTIPTLFGQSSDEPDQNNPDELNEYDASVVTSKKLNTQHSHIFLNGDDSVPVIKRLTSDGFDGLIDSGTASFEMLAWQVRRSNTKVMLISDGPDELAGGYHIDRQAWKMDQLRDSSQLAFDSRKMASSSRLGRRVLNRLGKANWLVPPDFSYSPFHFLPQHQGNNPDTLSRLFSASDIAASDLAFGLDDDAYADILPQMDPTQRRALSYAALSLPDMFNLRTDKAFLRAAVECRLPFQAPEMAEFQIALPAKLRFGSGDQTKYLLRKIVERRIGPEVANRSKHGFGAPLFKSSSANRSFDFESVIRSSPIFDDLAFKAGSRELSCQKEYGKLQWPLFVLAETYDQMKSGRYLDHKSLVP